MYSLVDGYKDLIPYEPFEEMGELGLAVKSASDLTGF